MRSLFKKKKPSSRRLPQCMVFIDWDGTMTDHEQKLSKERADRLAVKIKMMKRHCIVKILTLATSGWVQTSTEESGSKELVRVLKDVEVIAEDIRHPQDQNRLVLNRERAESASRVKLMAKKIRRPLGQDQALFAYKKTNTLLRMSKEYQMDPRHMYLLDDSEDNVEFAILHDFQAFLVNNDPHAIQSSLEYHLDDLLAQRLKKKKSSITTVSI